MSITCNNCEREADVFLVSERPSDRAEIVATLATCQEHSKEMFGQTRTLAEWDGQPRAVLYDVLVDYIMSPLAAERGHLWLTV